MKVIGLTGSFGTGKTFVASVMRSLGATVLDADAMAHRAVRKGTPAYRKIVAAFGKKVLRESGELDRRKLAAVVFADRKALRALERIVHPEVIRMIRARIRNTGPEDIVVIDAPLLVEAKLTGLVDKLVVVKCTKKGQIERCARKFRIKKAAVSRRIENQMPLRKKIRMADLVVDNSRTRSATRRQVERMWRESVWR